MCRVHDVMAELLNRTKKSALVVKETMFMSSEAAAVVADNADF